MRSVLNKSLLQELSIGSWIQIGHPAVAEIMASAGFDWLAIDLEHSTITLREAEDLIRIIDLKGLVPFARLSSNNPEQIKRVMDAGLELEMSTAGDWAKIADGTFECTPHTRERIRVLENSSS